MRGELQNTDFRTEHGCCTHHSRAAVVTCTRSSYSIGGTTGNCCPLRDENSLSFGDMALVDCPHPSGWPHTHAHMATLIRLKGY